MKISRLVGLVVLAISAMGLAAVSSASAVVPEFLPASGAFTAISGLSILREGADTLDCKKDSASGTITSSMTVGGIVVHFLECASSGATKAGCEVNSTNTTTKGLILTNTLHGVLGTVLPSGLAGLLLLPTASKVFFELASNECIPESLVTGRVAGLITPLGHAQTTGKLSFRVVSGKQEIKEIDTLGGPIEPELVAFSATAAEESEDAVTWSQPIEVM